MALTAAAAAREFASGPRVLQAAQALLAVFPIPALCEALEKAGPADVEPLIETLEALSSIEEVRGGLLEPEVIAFLQKGARSPFGRVRALVAKVLLAFTASEEVAGRLIRSGLLDRAILEALLLDDETGIAEQAGKVVRNVSRWPEGFALVCGSDESLAPHLHRSMAGLDDVKRVRVLSLFVELGSASEQVFGALEAQGAYKEVLGSFFTDDLLLKFNAVELFEALGSFPAGQRFLSQQGVPEQMVRELQGEEDPQIRRCLVRVLGLVTLCNPALVATILPGKEAPLAQGLARLLDSRDVADKLCGINAFADISASQQGLAFFLGWGTILDMVLAPVSASTPEVTKVGMAAWTRVLQPRPLEANSEAWAVAEDRVLPLALKNLTGKPFPDVRVLTWQMLAVLVRSPKAMKGILVAEQTREVLLDFTSESTYQARIAKHEFVTTLTQLHAAHLGVFLDERILNLLTQYVENGPNWAPSNTGGVRVMDVTA